MATKKTATKTTAATKLTQASVNRTLAATNKKLDKRMPRGTGDKDPEKQWNRASDGKLQTSNSRGISIVAKRLGYSVKVHRLAEQKTLLNAIFLLHTIDADAQTFIKRCEAQDAAMVKWSAGKRGKPYNSATRPSRQSEADHYGYLSDGGKPFGFLDVAHILASCGIAIGKLDPVTARLQSDSTVDNASVTAMDEAMAKLRRA